MIKYTTWNPNIIRFETGWAVLEFYDEYWIEQHFLHSRSNDQISEVFEYRSGNSSRLFTETVSNLEINRIKNRVTIYHHTRYRAGIDTFQRSRWKFL